ncbi:MAG TPA: SpoIIE family protein phosphatase [Pyrinomonadaceae bacterium]|jgi:sigma-B regulation protein RsbU (phosphoserine phosphatase)|nr:SpoIIE family protein phosphatase [Pyrinomonadaceae bacterium]
MVTAIEPLLREQLIDRREKLETAAGAFHRPAELTRLLEEVDAALHRMDLGTYGLCEVCHDPVESERLLADPLTRFCLGDLTPREQRALEEDLELASQIQIGLLPPPTQKIDGWEVSYHYQPAGAVSGDYCDLIRGDDQSLHFVLGDVSGKGVAASMLMAHLNAMFRTLISINLPLEQMMERASRVFCESTLPTQYATLVCGRATTDGDVEICNAGHLPPLLIQQGQITRIAATGLPVGVFCSESFSVNRVHMSKGDTLFLYTDGLSESLDGSGNEYGADRLSQLLYDNPALSTDSMISLCRRELRTFAEGRSPRDDLTLMAIRRTH